MRYNYKGEDITDIIPELISKSFGTGVFLPDGKPEIDWSCLSRYADDGGFDIRYYPLKTIVLDAGTRIIRYNNEDGHFSAPVGTPYQMLAMPYVPETIEYHEYSILLDTMVEVVAGVVAPGFDSLGSAIQYRHEDSFLELKEKGYIEEDFQWMKKEL